MSRTKTSYDISIATDSTDRSVRLQATVNGPDINLYCNGVLIGWIDGDKKVIVLPEPDDGHGMGTTETGYVSVKRS